jgi:hypothetical protein
MRETANAVFGVIPKALLPIPLPNIPLPISADFFSRNSLGLRRALA